MKVNHLSKEGYQKLNDELRQLKTDGRKQVAADIEEARSKGDLSENAEYDAAKEAQGLLEKKIAELENALANARIIDEKNIDASKVYVLSTVTILNKKNNKKSTYTLVSPQEADFNTGKISVESPIGKGLLGKEAGDVVTVKVPAGMLELEILSIERIS
ncbi:transcription elongation factor GreA [Cyclonatronum proteinivorum]|uniref:Transcription elongation factor GreA n=1 Tax=Cyclonatronum proteinivorum TaxID=1457365 RepID=A0A345UIX5_9BACT|nr:transcription elongation factor GreA [Cyclonatronum proteinivorum]AXJ00427.1 transcription elongation factor GreA [Cyclonatronum proteinivorum]